MKLFKLTTLSILFLFLLLPTSCSTWFTINQITDNNTYLNKDYVNSSYYKDRDEIGYYSNWCKNNDFGGRKLGTDKEKLSECIDAELRVQGIAFAFGGINNILTLILLPIFIFYLYFYYKWLKKNYFTG